MRFTLDQPRQLAALLWTLLGLFILRVTGQVLVVFFSVTFLPPMQEWYSGLLPYEYLLPSQIVIIVLMVKICLDFTRGAGPFVTPRRFFSDGYCCGRGKARPSAYGGRWRSPHWRSPLR